MLRSGRAHPKLPQIGSGFENLGQSMLTVRLTLVPRDRAASARGKCTRCWWPGRWDGGEILREIVDVCGQAVTRQMTKELHDFLLLFPAL